MAKRLIHTETHTTGTGTVHTAKVYRDSEWNEWVVKYAVDNHLLKKSDYHTDCKDDAIVTAQHHILRVSRQFA